MAWAGSAAWCIDHGIAAPDPDLNYVKTEVTEHAPETLRAMSWALFRAGAIRIGSVPPR